MANFELNLEVSVLKHDSRVSQVCALYAVALSLGDAETSSHV